MPEHAVLVRFQTNCDSDTFDSDVDEQIMQHACDCKELEYDGYDVDSTGHELVLYFYGRDARKMLDEVKTLLSKTNLKGAFDATLRFGQPDDENATEIQEEFEL
ncbi:MAG: hypothetical protein E6Q39_00870 [Crocinitomicaceae bacterium]|jgi:hypothetical protein|nr:MAG: hypothetical protein E6Q39_00870 [Crocinitomicaceae bacterium]